MNPVLARLIAAKQEQIDFVSRLLAQVETETRDLVDAERSNLEAAKQRIGELDAQIKPLEEFETIASAHRSAAPAAPARGNSDGPGTHLTVTEREHTYESPGEFMVDLVRSMEFPNSNRRPDVDALQRVNSAYGHRDGLAQARAAGDVAPGPHQTTDDTPPLLPKNVVGTILNDLDAARPFIGSMGALSLADRPGLTFQRPYITQHTLVGEQVAEKAELPTRELKMDAVDFVKRTFGGHINISRQTIDWTDPSAWNAVINDLVTQYGLHTEDTYSAAFAAGVTQSVTLDSDTVEGYVTALYEASVSASTGGGTKRATSLRMPNHIWTSLDMWADLGAKLAMLGLSKTSNPAGAESFKAFAGTLLDTPRTMVPGFPAGTTIVGRTELYEFYEQRIGMLQAVEPKVLGVDVAYGGYAAGNFLDTTGFSKIVAPTP